MRMVLVVLVQAPASRRPASRDMGARLAKGHSSEKVGTNVVFDVMPRVGAPVRLSFRSRFGPISLVYLQRLLRLLRLLTSSMVAVAQLVRAPDCGSGGCGFNPRQPPLDT